MNKLLVLVHPIHKPWDKIFVRLPESLLAIAALPHREGYDVRIVDQRVDPRWRKRLGELVGERPICVGITSLTGPCLQSALEAAAIVKAADQSVPVVFGGVQPTLLPEQTVRHPHVDVVVRGEGDYRFFEVVKCLEENRSLAAVRGIAYRQDGRPVLTEKAEMIADLDALPDSPYELVEMDNYSAIDLGRGKSATLPTSRGCPFKCSFCASHALSNRTWRGLSTERIVEKIELFQDRYDIHTFYFLDDCFSVGLSHFREVLAGLTRLDQKICWGTAGIRADLLCQFDDEDLSLLWESGCRSLDIGIESGSERMLNLVGKNETKEQMRTANAILARRPINLKYTFLMGYPTETEAELDESLDFSRELAEANPHCYSMFMIFMPILGTPSFATSLEHGFVCPEKIEDWVDMDFRKWLYHHPNWLSNRRRRHLEAIMTASLFCSKNAKPKLMTTLSKAAFALYHPIAKLRFRYKFFSMPLEIQLARMLLN